MIQIAAMKLILASGSPRRHKILKEMGYEFEIAVPAINEEVIEGETPQHHVIRVSRAKAESISNGNPGDLVLGADTIVVFKDKIFGKPTSESEAVSMLETLSGRTHRVYTGLSLLNRESGLEISNYDMTSVTFNELTGSQIDSYVKSGEPMDKAGSYGIQGMGSFLVEKIDGELDTVIGFPAKLFENMYREAMLCR